MNTNGWDAAGTYNFNRFLGATAEINGQYAGNFFGVSQVNTPRL